MTKKLDFDFLAIDKRLLGKGLTPIELLVYSQIAEYSRTTGDCFISDKTLAEMFGVSESTVSRAVKALEAKELITKQTKNTRSGKERHMTTNEPATVKMMLAENEPTVKMTLAQQSNCCLPNSQNDFIKENIKRKELKDNIGVDEESLASLELSSSTLEPAPDGSLENPFIIKNKDWFVDRYNYIVTVSSGLYRYGSKFYKLEENAQ